jgi:hypothetical protein
MQIKVEGSFDEESVYTETLILTPRDKDLRNFVLLGVELVAGLYCCRVGSSCFRVWQSDSLSSSIFSAFR